MRCSEPECKVHFNRDHGYVNIISEQVLGREHQNWCSTHNEPRAIIGLYPIGADPEPRRTWQCMHLQKPDTYQLVLQRKLPSLYDWLNKGRRT
jgi:hypothetical protein